MPAHPYLSGNFAPTAHEHPLTACSITGTLPPSLSGGQYIRNGSNPLHTPKGGEERPYHWFDGDGMLCGVLFGQGEAWFVNRLLVTDVLLASEGLAAPLLPSITTLVSPTTSLPLLTYHILRSLLLALSTHLTPSPLRSLSVANTSILFHARRALALCESGPPLEVRLPGLETVGWQTFSTHRAGKSLGGLSAAGGLLGFFRSWTGAHPHTDPVTGELLLLHSSFLPPYLRYTVLSPHGTPVILSAPIPLRQPKMMHDFAASASHTVILDLPLVFGPMNLLRGRPVLYYDRTLRSRFGLVPRYMQAETRWFEDDPCVVFHCVNAWDTVDQAGEVDAVNLLCCRFQSDALVFAAGNLPLSSTVEDPPQLHYYRFPLSSPALSPQAHNPSHSFPLLSIPFEFPCLPPPLSTRDSRFVFGCSMQHGSFTPALQGAKIDCLVRVDVRALIARGLARKHGAYTPVDARSMREFIASTDRDDPVRVFCLPPAHYASEPSFVPLPSFTPSSPSTHADGHLVFYVFDERQLLPDGSVREGARSELWVLDARDMATVVARVGLPGRVPYGLHGTFVTGKEITSQRLDRPIRHRPQSRSPQQRHAKPSGCPRGWSAHWLVTAVVKDGLAKGDPVELLLAVLGLLQILLGLGLVVGSYLNEGAEGGGRFGMEL
ncbi:carotenoid oxygenase [Calocera cornea HHB12733]|uniref:Carotenoid oxygenase n=1 Tax=Calocera cornea HHB12733 TaxID=1353952 RepID=A0A165DIZ8_9BASI|nr:carotenoid oxygenase [Calocera cornea HHB12733]